MPHDVAVGDRCGVCGEKRDNVLTLEVDGERAHARVELRAFPYRTCRYGHEKVYVYPDFGSDLNEFIFFGGGIALTKQKRRLLPGPELCSACGTTVPPDAEERAHEFSSEPTLGSAPPFGLRFRLPAVHCPNCGTAQVRKSRLRAINPMEAFVVAFDSAGIQPP